LIPRVHLFELEDQRWFPNVLRDLATDYLHFVERRLALHRPAVPLLADLLRTTGASRVVDLCSGGSGPVPELRAALADEGLDVHFTLTDFYPNLDAFEAAAARAPGAIAFVAEPVDARAVPARLKGVRTIFNAFHHFSPDDARAVLANAANAREPVAVFEISDRRLGVLLPSLILTPLLVLATTPFIRPLGWRRLLWTYLIPLVPLTCWWDGAVSQLRAYSPEELEQIADTAGATGFSWKAGRVPIGLLPGDMTYLMGWPTTA
jgi:hypothetical protein